MNLEHEPVRTKKSMVHWRIAEIARAMAHIYYDKFASNNQFYKMFPKEDQYVILEWPKFIPAARSTLVDMLTMDKFTMEQKDEIMEALLLDKSLPKAKTHSVIKSIKRASLLH